MSRSASQRTFVLQTLLCLESPNTQDHHTQEKGRIYAIQQEGQGVCVCVCVCVCAEGAVDFFEGLRKVL